MAWLQQTEGVKVIDVETTRKQFPALSEFVWFQNGGVSLTPVPVAQRLSELMQELLERGPVHIAHWEEEAPRRTASIERIATFFGVEAKTLALMRGVSEGFQTVLRGIDWAEGDEILITSEEEAALFLPALHLRDLFGVRVIKVPLCRDAEEQVDAFRARIGSRTKLVAFSHVTTDTGHRLPAEAICAAAAEMGALSFVDTAHSAGVFPVSLDAMGCDFAGILSYKWLYAPYASGVLYVRPVRLDAIRVTYAGGRSEAVLDWHQDRFEHKQTAERFQYGPWCWPLVHAWATSLDYLDGFGLDTIWSRTAELSTRLKDGLSSISGVRTLTPVEPDRSAALVSFEVAADPIEITGRLRSQYNIVIKPTHATFSGLRASIPFFLLEEEIDGLLAALAEELN